MYQALILCETVAVMSHCPHLQFWCCFAASPEGDSKVLSEVDKHQGRIRSFPHLEGSYATHVYISGLVPTD